MWELDLKESWAPKNWCFWTVVLEKTLKSPLDCKEIQPVHPEGNHFWIFIGRTDTEAEAPILLLPDAKRWLTGKYPDARKNWRQEKGTTEDEMVGLSLTWWTWVWASSGSWWWTAKPAMMQSVGLKESEMTEWLKWTEVKATQSCSTLCDPMDCSLQGCSVHGIL